MWKSRCPFFGRPHKIAPDCCLGLFKRLFRKTKVGCLEDVVAAVERSGAINHAQWVGTRDGTLCHFTTGASFLILTCHKQHWREYHKCTTFASQHWIQELCL